MTHHTDDTLAPPAWLGPVLGRIDALAASGAIFGCSRDACRALLCWLDLEACPEPITQPLADRQAALVWLAGHHQISALPAWYCGRLALGLAVWVDGHLRVSQCRSDPLDTLRHWLAEAYPDVRRRLDAPEAVEDDSEARLMVAMIRAEGRVLTAYGREYHVVGGRVYRVIGEACYGEVGVSSGGIDA